MRRKKASCKYFNDKEWIRFKVILPVQAPMVVTYFHCVEQKWVWNVFSYQNVVLKITLKIFSKLQT